MRAQDALPAATISAVVTAVPPHVLTQAHAIDLAERFFELDRSRAAALRTIFENAGVGTRYCVRRPDDMARKLSLGESNAIYCEHALALGRKVAREALARAELAAEQIDLVISVSCTGLMIPSLDAYLALELGMRADVKRLPITELGCAGGACALSRAYDYLRGHPGQNVLIVALELPSLTFQPGDLSGQNLISCALFGDGAAAAVMRGESTSGVNVLDTCSYQLPRTTDAMGFKLDGEGLHIVLSKEMPAHVTRSLAWMSEHFFSRHELDPRALAFSLLHPGGRKILDLLQTELGLSCEQLAPSRETLNDFGNMSAASVLFVFDAWQKRARLPEAGSRGLMLAFGPGISTEALLLEWR